MPLQIFVLYEEHVVALQQLFFHYSDLENSDVSLEGSKSFIGPLPPPPRFATNQTPDACQQHRIDAATNGQIEI